MIIVEQTDPRQPETVALLEQSHALMTALFPPEDNFYLEVNDLVAPHIRFFTARINDRVLGTGALAIKADYGEVKSMFVDETARGQGVADAILRQIEDEARAEGLSLLKLETGNILYAAHRVYDRHGFTPCGPFGEYENAKSSIFMEKAL